VQQGQVERLVAQGEEGFLKMLKEVTGTEAFDSRVDKMQSTLNECNQKKQQMDKILEAIRTRLEQLEQEIGEYRFIENIERERRALELALYQRKTQANRAEIEHFRSEKLKLLDERQELIN
jgi:structural maintenance of chromosome 3 (chondroitin sulfate proteoglycan 6)